MKIKNAVVTSAFTLCLGLSTSSHAGYSFLDLGFDSPLGINNVGQVVGSRYGAPVLWDGGVVTELPTLGGVGGTANAINDSGVIVGYSQTADNQGHATLWQNGIATDLGNGNAWAINNNGVILGSTELLTTFPGYHAINDQGQRVGGGYAGLGSFAYDINDAGEVVGFSDIFQATYWFGGTTVDLSLGGSFDQSWASGINDKGQIVGAGYLKNTPGLPHAGIWENGQFFDLNHYADLGFQEAGWTLMNARDINNDGWIIAQAVNSQSQARVFLLSPCDTCQYHATIPEPVTSVLMLTGLGLLGVTRRRTQARS